MGQLFFHIITGLFFIFLGFLIERYPQLISGYNTLPKYKRDKIDIRPYALYTRKVMVLMGSIIIIGACILYSLKLVDWAIGLMLVTILSGAGILVKRGRELTKDLGNAKWEKWSFRIAVFVTVVTLIFIIDIGVPAKISVEDNALLIKGSYKQHIPTDSILSVEITETAPSATMKTNGLSFWRYHKGYFHTKEYGRTLFFLHSGRGPYLIIQSKRKPTIVINRNTKDEIAELYRLLRRE